jgi:hypothetical protein
MNHLIISIPYCKASIDHGADNDTEASMHPAHSTMVGVSDAENVPLDHLPETVASHYTGGKAGTDLKGDFLCVRCIIRIPETENV